jgi:hypothetical protein
MGLFNFLKKKPAQDSAAAAKKEPIKQEPLDKRLLQEPEGMSLIEKHYFYEEQIHAFYKRRDEDQKYINMTIAACEKQIAIAKEVAKKRPLVGKDTRQNLITI